MKRAFLVASITAVITLATSGYLVLASPGAKPHESPSVSHTATQNSAPTPDPVETPTQTPVVEESAPAPKVAAKVALAASEPEAKPESAPLDPKTVVRQELSKRWVAKYPDALGDYTNLQFNCFQTIMILSGYSWTDLAFVLDKLDKVDAKGYSSYCTARDAYIKNPSSFWNA